MVEVGGLTIDVSAEVADAVGGMKAVREQLEEVDGDALAAAAALEQTGRSADELASESTELAASLEILEQAANDAEDSTEELGDTATTTAGQMSVLGASANAAVIDFGLLNVQLTATTTILLGGLLAGLSAVSVALLAIVGIIGSVVGAFGILLGAGLATEFGRISRTLQLVGQEIEKALEPLAERFLPIIIAGITSLDDLVENIVAAIGDTEAFEQALTNFGSALFEVIPDFVALMFRVAEVALPLLADFFRFLESEGPGALQLIADTTREILPQLIGFGQSLLEASVLLVEFGTVLTQVVLPAVKPLLDLLAGLGDILNALPDGMLQAIAITGLLAAAFTGLGGPIATVTGALVGVRIALDAIKIVADGFEAIFEPVIDLFGRLTGQARLAEQAVRGVAGALSGAGIGAVIGGVAGSVVPGVGTFAGAAVGAGVGGTVGGAAGAAVGVGTADRGLGSGPQNVQNISVESINANSRREGRAAARGIQTTMRGNTQDTSRGL